MGLERKQILAETNKLLSAQRSSQNGNTVSLGWHSSGITNTTLVKHVLNEVYEVTNSCFMLRCARTVSALTGAGTAMPDRSILRVTKCTFRPVHVAWHQRTGCRCLLCVQSFSAPPVSSTSDQMLHKFRRYL